MHRSILSSLSLFLLLLGLPDASAQSVDFPTDWTGQWQGELQIFRDASIVKSLPMELQIAPTDTSEAYTWTLIYGADSTASVRNYLLQPDEPEKGHFRIDEQNSIAMEGYFLDGVFYQWFSVQGNLLLTRTQRVSPKVMVWEIVTGSLTPVSETGGEVMEGVEIPSVETYPVKAVQKAILTRAED